MNPGERPMDAILQALQERAKELNCLYRVDEILNQPDVDRDAALRQLVRELPSGWQYPDRCVARVVLEGQVYQDDAFVETPWVMKAQIHFEGAQVGELSVNYTRHEPVADEGPFLKEERRLINAIAERLGHYILQRRLKRMRDAGGTHPGDAEVGEGRRWNVILEFLRSTDRRLLVKLTRRMINYLGWSGAREADTLLHEFAPQADLGDAEENRPMARTALRDLTALAERTFRLASEQLTEEEALNCIRSWIKEDRASFLYAGLENLETSLSEIAGLVERFQAMDLDFRDLPIAVQTGLKVALLRRFFTEQLDFINNAKDVVEIGDFHDLVKHSIFPPSSHGKLGGKSAGLFVASRILARSREQYPILNDVRVPRTWYVASDALLYFIRYNNLEDVYDRKYREIDQIRQEYPYLVQVFKGSPFPPELAASLSSALDEIGERPIIVRSSSLLEDRVGSAFSGKYKSLFLANQGAKPKRLAALQDAIAEVYASVFGPDPIEYRTERGLLDVHEEMGIMIQEVVGRRVGPYFLPAFSGVAYGNNEFRWSPRIRREDGLMRIVPGLGTRAVDRLSDDYPILVAPGQPKLRVNTTPDEIIRYSPKKVDVLNLESNAFETVDVDALLRQYGGEYPLAHLMVSSVEHGHIRKPIGSGLDFARGDHVVTFEGLIADTDLVPAVRTMLNLLRERMGVAVDLEFASDGEHFHLLQCRAQGYSSVSAPTPIPRDIPTSRMLFTARRYVSNGRMADVTHVVYVDDEAYANLPDTREMRRVGEAVGRLNALLPKRQFILVGPGRWGSRGDIRMGVPVTYSQISNTAMLIEVARQRGNYTADLSFGTHFFQDLVEADIRYLPLYPDDPDIVFNQGFFRRSRNILAELLPQYADLADTLRVIDVSEAAEGKILRVLLNAEIEQAVGLLAPPGAESGTDLQVALRRPLVEPTVEDHWRWRLRMAERIAALIDARRFGVQALYVFGSTKNATAAPGSDLDLIVHVRGTPEQQRALSLWLDGWSRALAEVNFLRTGYRSDGLLDVHFVTDDDIEQRTSFAAKIGAVTDAARSLPLGESAPPGN